MNKIIKFSPDYKSTEEYRSMLAEVILKLNIIEDDLQTLTVNLASVGKWKKWSDSIPTGGTFSFTEEMLRDTGDKNVDSLAGLLDEVIAVKKKISKK